MTLTAPIAHIGTTALRLETQRQTIERYLASGLTRYEPAVGFTPQRQLPRVDFESPQGVAAFAAAHDVTEHHVRTRYAGLNALFGKGWRTDRPSNANLRVLSTLPGTAREIYEDYKHIAATLEATKRTEFKRAMSSEVMDVFEHALGVSSFTCVGDYLGNHGFDRKGNLEPDPTDGKRWLTIEIAKRDERNFLAEARSAGFTVEKGRRDYAGGRIGIRFDVTAGADKPGLLALVTSANAGLGHHEWSWLLPRDR